METDDAIGTVRSAPLLPTVGPHFNLSMPSSHNKEILKTEEYIM